MVDVEKSEIYLSGYMQSLVGREFTQDNLEVIFSHIDSMLHKQNLDKINECDLNEMVFDIERTE